MCRRSAIIDISTRSPEVEIPQLIVRNLGEEVVRALKEAAGRHGRSAEEEHRQILRDALLAPPTEDAKAILLEMPDVGDDSDFERVPDQPRTVDL